MATVDCTIHLISLQPGKNPQDILALPINPPPIVKGRPLDWVHPPRKTTKEVLTDHKWDLFLLTDHEISLPPAASDAISCHITINVKINKAQYDDLHSRINTIPTPIPTTPPLPKEWPKNGGIPTSSIDNQADSQRVLRAGELKLDTSMAHFLSTTLPSEVRNRPISLFNLFKYPAGDAAVHDAYMEGFKDKFGDAAGARVKFMGPVEGGIRVQGGDWEGSGWQDANLVQYDTIWHYAYMLSTEVYQGLNRQKMDGLEDTCILCVSEIEVMQ